MIPFQWLALSEVISASWSLPPREHNATIRMGDTAVVLGFFHCASCMLECTFLEIYVSCRTWLLVRILPSRGGKYGPCLLALKPNASVYQTSEMAGSLATPYSSGFVRGLIWIVKMLYYFTSPGRLMHMRVLHSRITLVTVFFGPGGFHLTSVLFRMVLSSKRVSTGNYFPLSM